MTGPGDIDFYFFKLLGFSKEKFGNEIEQIAKNLVDADAEIVLLPDKGVCFEVARMYKDMGGKKIIGLVPKDDKNFGIDFLKKYIDSGIFDEIINTGDWYKHDMTYCLYGNKILFLGFSLGSLGEISYGYYLYKLWGKKKLFEESRAGKNFDLIIFESFIKNKINKEIEEYIKKKGSKIVYVNSENLINNL